MCSFQYLQQQIPVLYNEFTTTETICIVLQSMFVHSHLQTECWVFPQYFVGQIHKEYCCHHEMIHMVCIHISVFIYYLYCLTGTTIMLFFTCRLNTNVGIPYHTIPSLQFIASYSNYILKHMLLNNITRFSETCMCLCSFKYLQQEIPLL